MYALRFQDRQSWEEVTRAFATYDEAHTLATEISERSLVAAYLIAADHVTGPFIPGTEPKIKTMIVHFWTIDSSAQPTDFWHPERGVAA
jgi:hypothetical protein